MSVHPIFADILDSIMGEPRFAKQERLDNLIREFNPDYEEATELLDALFAGFKYRYSDDEWARIDRLLESFKDKLHRVSQMYAEDDPE